MMSMKRIVVDGRWIKYSGIGRYVENLLIEIIRQDSKNHYIILVRPGESDCLPLPKGRVEYVETDIVWYTPQEQIALPKLLDSLNPDLVHFTNFNVPLGYRKLYVVTVHDLTLLRFKNIRGGLLAPFTYRLKDVVMRHVLKTAVKRSRVIFTPSEFVKQDIAKRYRVKEQKKLIVTHNAADKPHPKQPVNLKRFNLKSTDKFLLYVGNAYPHKNLERLIVAYQKLIKDAAFGHKLVLAGRKDEFHLRLEKLVKKRKLQDHIIFTDYVTDEELAELYRRASLYVFPSLSEGFGIPGLEAMAWGLPVVSSNATCLPEIYGEAVEYFDPKNPQAIADVISSVLSSKQRQAELVKLGYTQVKKYSWAQSAGEIIKGYRQALKK
jgi:glycosyltransferase involved in cell wall biosynthesis